jgi:hypothetical protein
MVRHFHLLTDEHLHAFGIIVHQFALFERLIELCIAACLGSRLPITAIAISQLSYSAKSDSLKSILYVEGSGLFDHRQQLSSIVDRFNEYSPIRNAVAHHQWIEGTGPNSIKPLIVSSRGGKPKIRGLLDEDKDYLPDELFEIGDRLNDIRRELMQFTVDIGVGPSQEEIMTE